MFLLEKNNTYNIKSYAKYVYFPISIKEIIQIYKKHKKVIILGNGSNIILAKDFYYKTAFIILKNTFNNIYHFHNIIYAHSGVLLKRLSLYAYSCNLSGLETFFDIPATVGGAIIMNASAYKDSIFDNLLCVDIFYSDTCIKKRMYKKDISYGYRYSMFQNKNIIIIGACFKLNFELKSKIKDKMSNIFFIRKNKLPFLPSAGSVFKRPIYHITVGEMIENIGLKGFNIGNAQISNKHAGIIVNTENATGKDILHLIKYIKKCVLTHYNIKLDLEQIPIY